jgi:replicative DNA helicase
MTIELEQILLGSLLANNEIYDEISIDADDFEHATHAKLFYIIEERISKGKNCDWVIVKDIFDNDASLQEVGGSEYIQELQETDYTGVNIHSIVETIKSKAWRRQIMNVCSKIIYTLENPDDLYDKSEFIEQIETIISNNFEIKEGGYSIQECVDLTLNYINDAVKGEHFFYPTYYEDLNDLIVGFKPQSLYVIAGRPAMGKTAIALNLASFLSISCPVKFFSLEMAKEELVMRQLASRTNISVQKQMKGELSHGEIQDLVEAREDIIKYQLNIDDTGGVTIQYIMSQARKFARQNNKCAIFIDYLGLIKSKRNHYNTVSLISEITQSLKSLAKEINAPVVLLSQLSREVEKRDDKRPMLSDLRDSGSIEQDADVVMFPFREEYYALRDKPIQKAKESEENFDKRMGQYYARINASKGKAELIVSKNRQGELGTVSLKFDGQRQRFK